MEPSFENLEQANLIIAPAIQLSQSSFSNEKSSIISFPAPSTQCQQLNPSNHQQLYNILIRHKRNSFSYFSN
jgi:hypothetical protein